MSTATFMTIGEFAARTRLSVKALRLYDELALVVPARIDPNSGYRLYTDAQVDAARLVGMLRRADMPLALISTIVGLDAADAARALADWWAREETATAQRRALVAYLLNRFHGRDQPVYDVMVRSLPERSLLVINRHVRLDETERFFGSAFAQLRAGGPGLDGIAGVPFLVFYGEVSADSDGPIELCRPVADGAATELAGDLQLRTEPAHDEAYIRLAQREMGWPAMLPALDALEAWAEANERRPADAVRQLLIADQRTATPDTPVCDLSVPLR